ncbi:uncharacterized protein LOC107265470 [Cephus cinctus]|uniref:Uncharacterized protein LOC107265470 n=1 Tax=Cephus cinctus TaxID=211228 RepID=A0AAJ7BND6_CEPCN|nr:uncharacterized protein LOC107265470 [Cephus cinctus]
MELQENYDVSNCLSRNYSKEDSTSNLVSMITSNWTISNNRRFQDSISVVPLSQAAERTDLADMVSPDSCIQLQSLRNQDEPCTIDIEVTGGRKIARIAVVSEASILEFYKQYGEYAVTALAEFIDEFENNFSYFAEVTIEPPSSEIKIKFAKVKSKTLFWVYGIRLILTDPVTNNVQKTFDYDVINSFLQNTNGLTTKGAEMAKKLLQTFDTQGNDITGNDFNPCLLKLSETSLQSQIPKHHKSLTTIEKSTIKSESMEEVNCENTNITDIRTYIDNKLCDMEKRLMQRIEVMEQHTNKKLDTVLQQLEKLTTHK